MGDGLQFWLNPNSVHFLTIDTKQKQMKNSTLLQIKTLPELVQKNESNSCGAYCVAATLACFGLFPSKQSLLINRFNIEANQFNGKALHIPLNISLNNFADYVYQITGILDVDEPSQYVEKNGLNSLAAMFYALEKYNLNVAVLFKDKSKFENLKKTYPNEIELLCKNLKANIYINNSVSTISNCVTIYAISYNNGNTHYIACNSSGNWYDPAEGNYSTNFNSIEQFTEMYGGEWLGVSLVCNIKN